MDELEVNETYKINGSLCLDRSWITIENILVKVIEKNTLIHLQINENSKTTFNQAIEKHPKSQHMYLKQFIWDELQGELVFALSEQEDYEDIIITK